MLVTSEKVLKPFPLEPCVVSTQEAAVVTHQVKLFVVGASSEALRPPVPHISEITNTHRQITRINISIQTRM